MSGDLAGNHFAKMSLSLDQDSVRAIVREVVGAFMHKVLVTVTVVRLL